METRASAAAEWSRHEIETLAKKCHVALAGAAIAGAARAGAAVDGIDAVESLDAIGAKVGCSSCPSQIRLPLDPSHAFERVLAMR